MKLLLFMTLAFLTTHSFANQCLNIKEWRCIGKCVIEKTTISDKGYEYLDVSTKKLEWFTCADSNTEAEVQASKKCDERYSRKLWMTI